jgi:hypothetical protein
MLRWALFEVIFLGSCGYALVRGGAPERIAAITFLVSATLTMLLRQPDLFVFMRQWPSPIFQHIETGVTIVDSVMLVVMLALALFSERFWPIWMAAMAGITVLTHFTMLLRLDLLPWAYWRSQALWSYPMLLLLTAATWRHRRRLRLIGADRSWRPS